MVKFINRITGKISNELPENPLLSQWQIVTEDETIMINSVKIQANSQLYLWVDLSHNLVIFSSQNNHKIGQFKIEKWQSISDLLKESFRFFYHQSQGLKIEPNLWSDWINLSPLVPEINQKIHLQPLEIKTQEKLGHIEIVCHRPRTYLKMETEKLPVSRVKKIAPRAIEHLASHTEDWNKRNFSSVNPKNLLCLVREDLLNIYENQVTAKLIDNLLEYISRRLQELKLIKSELNESLDFSNETHNIHWRNRDRICSLWGTQFDAEIGIIEIEETLVKLEQLKRKLLGLISTELYKAIPKQTYVPITLKRTNIFVNDQHYRYVDLLWRNWSKWKSDQLKNPIQLFQENQELFKGFEAFCRLLICKALTGNNTDKELFFDFDTISQVLNFDSKLGKITLEHTKQGTFYLQSKIISKKLHFIPLLLNLTGRENEGEINSILNKFTDNFDNSSDNIILYLGTKEERENLSINLQKRLNSISIKDNNLNGFLPISPFELLSLERVAHAIKWWLNGRIYLSYPPVLNINIPSELLTYMGDCLVKINNNSFQILNFLLPENKNSFNQELEKQINKTRSMGKTGITKLTQLNAIKKENIPEKIENLIYPFTICPVCQNEDNNKITTLNHHSFECQCNSCQTIWGTKNCGNCQKNYPFISITGIENQKILDNFTNLDRIFGRDFLAIPHKKADKNISFICSFCGSN